MILEVRLKKKDVEPDVAYKTMRLICFYLCLFSFNSFGQQLNRKETKQLLSLLESNKIVLKPVRQFHHNYLSKDKIKQLQVHLCINKSFPKRFEKQILIALSFYPELKDVSINFVQDNIKTTMSCRPSANSLSRRFNREYIITIDSDDEGEGILLDNVPFNAQIGVIGHELAHIVDFETKNSLDILKLGLDYINGHYPPKFEKSIDEITIKKGLGWQLLDWSNFVLHKSKASESYKDFKRNTYLTPKEILVQLNQNKDYY